MAHTYDELRAIAIDILAGREKSHSQQDMPAQLSHLRSAVAEVLGRREGRSKEHGQYQLEYLDDMAVDEIFWDLFREGVITFGYNQSNREYPWFRVARLGKQIFDGEPYSFHDVSSYEAVIRREVPAVEPGTLLYALEAMRAYKSHCVLSATVMVGVALEDAVLSLFDAIASNAPWKKIYKKVFDEFHIAKRVKAFRDVSDQHLKAWPSELREGFDAQFVGVQELIRNYRNEAGHPTEKLVSPEVCFTLLQIFVPSCRKVYDLREHFKSAPPP